jgi:cysteinyl-tRNA synthetase, unknown class
VKGCTLLIVLLLSITPLLMHSGPSFTPKTFAYVLQADDKLSSRKQAIKILTECDRDLIILDYSYSSSRFGKWTKQELSKIRSGKKGRRIVSYISIGEAEKYRGYWKPAWDQDNDGRPDKAAPSFLLTMNPSWAGNYRVRYWDPEWQKIILRYVDEIVQQGFDGLYLDIVDAFQGFEYNPKNNKWVKDRINPLTNKSYRREMVDWVKKVAQRARRQKKEFLIIPQNGSDLLEHKDYLAVINAIALEDFFTEGNKKQPTERLKWVTTLLAPIQRAKKPVLMVEYPTKKKLKEYVIESAKQRGFPVLITTRSLKLMGESY